MQNEVIFSELDKYVVEKQNVTFDECDAEKWLLMPYSSSLCDGNMLLAKDSVYPADITLRLGLNGRYNVYVGIFNDGWDDYLHIKTSDQECFTGVRFNKTVFPRPRWKFYENIQEVLVMTADLTGQDLIISKPSKNDTKVSCLAWVRCVKADKTDPLDDFTNPETKKLHLYFDLDDVTYFGDVSDVNRSCMLEHAAVQSDASLISRDVVPPNANSEKSNRIPVLSKWNGVYKNQSEYLAMQDKVVAKRIEIAKNAGIPYYAAFRIQVSDFIFLPESLYNFDARSIHPEYRCVWRDGTEMSMFSYAFEAVRKQVTDLLISELRQGYDGVTLIVHRGITVGFEQPVVDLFNEKYPGVDCRRLPLGDERLIDCRTKFFTDFVKELRAQMDKVDAERSARSGIHVIAGTDLRNMREQGVDVEELARLGLIDGVSQDNMLVWEDLTGCMSDSEPDLIDLLKYRYENKKRAVIKRNFDYSVSDTAEKAKDYIKLCREYGVRFFGAMSWEHSQKPHTYVDDAQRMYAAGAENLLRWNCGQMMSDPAVWNVCKRLGHDLSTIDPSEYCRHYRTLKIGGSDISLFNPDWRG